MCGICIAGFCIPYSALIPMLLIGLQWMAAQFSKVGLGLPEFVYKRLGLNSAGKKPQQEDSSWCDKVWCFCKKPTRKGIDSAATTAVIMPDDDVVGIESKAEVLAHIDNQQSGRRRDSQDSFATAATSDDDDSEGASDRRWDESLTAFEKINSIPLNDHVKLPAAAAWWCQPCDAIQTETR